MKVDSGGEEAGHTWPTQSRSGWTVGPPHSLRSSAASGPTWQRSAPDPASRLHREVDHGRVPLYHRDSPAPMVRAPSQQTLPDRPYPPTGGAPTESGPPPARLAVGGDGACGRYPRPRRGETGTGQTAGPATALAPDLGRCRVRRPVGAMGASPDRKGGWRLSGDRTVASGLQSCPAAGWWCVPLGGWGAPGG